MRDKVLEEEMATHSSIFAWRVLWTEEPGRSQRVGHNWSNLAPETKVQLFTIFMSGRFLEEDLATHSSILAGESHGQSSLTGYYRVAKSQTRLTWLSTHTSLYNRAGLTRPGETLGLYWLDSPSNPTNFSGRVNPSWVLILMWKFRQTDFMYFNIS